ncbi:MAG: hypothetical protein COB38_09345 [Gammaproteobacteria bacterium]|nr:MAG: hypothetical protein COB38_09345 [Gammaproteobacteria bacterium]
MKYLAKIKFFLLLSCLAACTNHSPAPVDDLRYSHQNKNHSQSQIKAYNQVKLSKVIHHKVMRGETLFSIAWRYSLDYHLIAKLNELKAFRIYPGQELLLRKKELPAIYQSTYNAPSLIAAINSEFLHKSEKQANTNNVYKSAQVVTNNAESNAKKEQRFSNHSKQLKEHRKQYRARSSNNKIENWIWPVNGKVVQGFSSKQNQNKGLDIKAKKGSAVRATAPGKVVYSGNGLKGYGQLVIIKHNDSYLSAYAHNNKIHVLENEVVKAGQRIADLGNSGSDIFKLHFEIHYKGKPVNPLNYLPKAG